MHDLLWRLRIMMMPASWKTDEKNHPDFSRWFVAKDAAFDTITRMGFHDITPGVKWGNFFCPRGTKRLQKRMRILYNLINQPVVPVIAEKEFILIFCDPDDLSEEVPKKLDVIPKDRDHLTSLLWTQLIPDSAIETLVDYITGEEDVDSLSDTVSKTFDMQVKRCRRNHHHNRMIRI